MSMVMLNGALVGGIGFAMKGFQRLRSSQPGHPIIFAIALVRSISRPLPRIPVFPRLPRKTQNCAMMISMRVADIYGSIPEGFS